MYHNLLLIEIEVFTLLATFYLGFKAGMMKSKRHVNIEKQAKLHVIVAVLCIIIFTSIMGILDIILN